jgi:hypothetical protein
MDGRAAVKWGGGLAHRHDLEGEARRLICDASKHLAPLPFRAAGLFYSRVQPSTSALRQPGFVFLYDT